MTEKPDTASLRAECDRLLLAELDRVGIPEQIDRAPIIEALAARGVPHSTAYRWIGQFLASGRPGQHLARTVRAAVDARAARGVDPAAEAAAEVAAVVPPLVGAPELLGIPSVGAVLERLETCLAAAEQVMKYARTPEGAVRNAKGLLSASEHLRRTLETAVKMQESLIDVAQIRRYLEVVTEILREEQPDLVERVLHRFRAIDRHLDVAFAKPPGGQGVHARH